MYYKSTNLLFISLFLLPFVSHAEIAITDNISISGFGSTSVTQSDNETPLFVNREISDDNCFDCDTIIGLQTDIDLSENFDASVQIVKRPQDEWSSPEVEWAYLSYQYDEINLKAGRLRLPMFLKSEYYYVGQAYISARPQQEVYDSLLGFTSYEGLSLTWDYELSDEYFLTFSPFAGLPKVIHVDLGEVTYDIDTKKALGAYAELTSINYRIRLGYAHFKYIVTAHSPLGSETRPEDRLNVLTLGAEYSLDDWTFTGEVEVDEMQANWYTTVAYTYGTVIPYLTYAEAHQDHKNETVLAGLRFDLADRYSLNLEWQYTESDGTTRGQFVQLPSQTDKDANLYTLMFNFIF